MWNIISFSSLTALTFIENNCSSLVNSSLVKRGWDWPPDSRIPVFNVRLTIIGSFLSPLPLFPSRTASSATHDKNLFLLGLIETPWWMKFTCQSCLNVLEEVSLIFLERKVRREGHFLSRMCTKAGGMVAHFLKSRQSWPLRWTCSGTLQALSILQVPHWHEQCLTYQISLGPPCTEGSGKVSCEVVLCSCTGEA